jgi:hypothetical protein
MRRVPFPRSLALIAVAAGLLASGCGGADEQLPKSSARALVRDIDAVEQGVRAGECDDTRSPLRRLKRTAGDLPADVDAELQTTLQGGVGRLERLARAECRQREPEPVEPEPEQLETPPVYTEPEPAPEPEPEPELEQPVDPTPEEKTQEPPEEEPKEEKPAKDNGPKQKNKEKPKDTVPDPCPPGSDDTC